EVDAADTRMRHRAAHGLHMGHPRELQVVDVDRVAGDVAARLLALLRAADHVERLGLGSHAAASSSSRIRAAAFWTASMIGSMPVHRQMLFESASAISSRVGSGLRSSSALAAVIIPGEQNPHWVAKPSWKAAWSGL